MTDIIEKNLLLVDDDNPFLTRLGRAMETRGFTVRLAGTVADGIAEVKKDAPNYAVVDLRLTDGNGRLAWRASITSKPLPSVKRKSTTA